MTLSKPIAQPKPKRRPMVTIRQAKMRAFVDAVWRTNRIGASGKEAYCRLCFRIVTRGVNAEVDHIKPRSTHPELRYDVSNGRILCKECHQNQHGRVW